MSKIYIIPLTTGGLALALLSLPDELGPTFVVPALDGRDRKGGCGITLVCHRDQNRVIIVGRVFLQVLFVFRTGNVQIDRN